MASQKEIRERVAKQIVEELQRGGAPWIKPWVGAVNSGFPSNVISKKTYRGINPLLLEMAAQKRRFSSKWWGTYRQWVSLGGQVKKRPDDVASGEWGTKVVFFKPIKRIKKDDQGEEKVTSFPLLRDYVVFNADQVEGEVMDKFRVQPPSENSTIDFEPAETVIAATGADIRHQAGSEAAYYRPPLDHIVLPLKSQFENGPGGLAGYYDTAFHELGHWSEHRLKWTGSYALGELRAEMAACFLSAEIGVPTVGKAGNNHAKYLESWIKTMNEDHRVIFRISSAATAAADFILSFSKKEQVVVEGDAEDGGQLEVVMGAEQQ